MARNLYYTRWEVISPPPPVAFGRGPGGAIKPYRRKYGHWQDTERDRLIHRDGEGGGRGPAVHGLPRALAALLCPARELTEEVFEKGLGFDGSSIRGWQAINESDMLVKPVADTAFVDPFLAAKTLVIICNIADPITGEDYSRDPRNIARKAELS